MRGGAPPGGVRVRAEILPRGPAGAMLALLDRDPDGLREGDPLPLGWHWFHFARPVRASGLGVDGHERRGTFMPEVELPRRMWAGGTLRSLGPLRIGERAELRSRVNRVEEKRGRSGRLAFVTVGHTVLQGGRARVEEEQVIVYRGGGAREGGSRATGRGGVADAARVRGADPARIRSAGPPLARAADAPRTPGADLAQAAATDSGADVSWRETFLPTPITLFRFSALTHNAHRIHYDHAYATEVEGYPGLVVHGPLTALLLLDAAGRHGAAPVTRFRYRALAPLFVDRAIELVGRPGLARVDDAGASAAGSSPGERVVEAVGPDGTVAMRGWVE